jgi:hypothetical protein
MLFSNLKEIGVDKKGTIAQAVILLPPEFIKCDWRTELVRLLARIAVFRWAAFKKRIYKDEDFHRDFDFNEPPDGPTFRLALDIMEKRASRLLNH